LCAHPLSSVSVTRSFINTTLRTRTDTHHDVTHVTHVTHARTYVTHARTPDGRAQSKLSRAFKINPQLQVENPQMDEFVRLVNKWQDFVRIEGIMLQLRARSIARMPLALAVGALKSLYVLVKQCERSFQQLGIRNQLLTTHRQIKYFQQRLHQVGVPTYCVHSNPTTNNHHHHHHRTTTSTTTNNTATTT
jgi:hypothetical protein